MRDGTQASRLICRPAGSRFHLSPTASGTRRKVVCCSMGRSLLSTKPRYSELARRPLVPPLNCSSRRCESGTEMSAMNAAPRKSLRPTVRSFDTKSKTSLLALGWPAPARMERVADGRRKRYPSPPRDCADSAAGIIAAQARTSRHVIAGISEEDMEQIYPKVPDQIRLRRGPSQLPLRLTAPESRAGSLAASNMPFSVSQPSAICVAVTH